MNRLAIAVDIGATNLRVVVGTPEGKIIKKIVERTVREGDELAVSNQIVRMINSILSREDLKKVEGIGIGTIGPLDLKRGAIVNTPNLPFEYIPLRDPLEEKFHLPVYIANDCVAAVIGEHYYGAGKGLKNHVYITISTGIGAGVYVDGHVLVGKDGNAHEVGHTVIDMDGKLVCGCGKRGHWEAYCSGANIPRFARYLIEVEKRFKNIEESLLYEFTNGDFSRLTAKMIFDAAKKGDKVALAIVKEIGRLNAIGFANVVSVYDPELITVGGSVVLNNPELTLPYIKENIGDYTINRLPEIKITPLAGDVVIYGALALVFYKPEEVINVSE